MIKVLIIDINAHLWASHANNCFEALAAQLPPNVIVCAPEFLYWGTLESDMSACKQ